MEKSLTEIIGGTNLDIWQEGELTRIDVHDEKRSWTISLGDITLSHDPKEYWKNPAMYISSQLESHSLYLKRMRDKAERLNLEILEMSNNQADLARSLEHLPTYIIRLNAALARIILAPQCWLKLTTIERAIDRQVSEYSRMLDGYQRIQLMVNYGIEFTSERLAASAKILSDKAREELTQLVETQQHLYWVYSRIIKYSERRVEHAVKSLEFMYPERAVKTD